MTTFLLLLLSLSPGSVAHADDAAELIRLEGEMKRLSQRNAWGGVDQAYRDALELGVEIDNDVHWFGVQAALTEGRMLSAWHRIERMETPDGEPAPDSPWARARGELSQISERYGLVAISVGDDAMAVLTRPEMPFAQRERDAIAFARESVRTDRAFRGLLPTGSYQVDDQTFDVEPSETWQVVVVE